MGKRAQLEEITFHLISNSEQAQKNIESLQIGKDPSFALSKKQFCDSVPERETVYEYLYETKDPYVEEIDGQLSVYVSGKFVGTIKENSKSRYKNLVKSERFDHIFVILRGGKYKRYWTYTNKNYEEVVEFDSDISGYGASLYVYALPKGESNNSKSEKVYSENQCKKRYIIYVILFAIFALYTATLFSSNLGAAVFGILLSAFFFFKSQKWRKKQNKTKKFEKEN